MVKKLPSFQLFCLGNIGQENVFNDILEQINAFLGYKNNKFKSRKMDIFPKGLTHGFGPKLAIFKLFCLGNIGQENVFYDILERKNAYLGYKNKKFKNSKNWHFFKGVKSWFWSENNHFSNLYLLGNIRQENVFYNIEEGKNACLGYKKKKFKKWKKWTIFLRG